MFYNSIEIFKLIFEILERNINKKYLEKIYENLTDEVKDSFYGEKLSSMF